MSDRPTRDLTLPEGCIYPDQLRSLAIAMEKLQRYHTQLSGTRVSAPCLRRIEATQDGIVAHISTGAAVNGDWLKLKYSAEEWVVAP